MEASLEEVLSVTVVGQDLLEELTLFVLCRVAEEGLRVLLQAEYEFLQGKHLGEARVFPLNTDPDLLRWLLVKHFAQVSWQCIYLIVVFSVLGKRR